MIWNKHTVHSVLERMQEHGQHVARCSCGNTHVFTCREGLSGAMFLGHRVTTDGGLEFLYAYPSGKVFQPEPELAYPF